MQYLEEQGQAETASRITGKGEKKSTITICLEDKKHL
jgi:hypothetical protein